MERENIFEKLNKIYPILKEKYYVKNMGIFGSYARGEEKEGSDLDILVEFEKTIGLFKFIELENYISDTLGIKIDLVSKKALKPRIGRHILKEVVNI